jgi:Protein of unknown function (DUF3017)
MANRPVNTGSGGAAAPPSPDAAPPYGTADPYATAAPPAGHRAARAARTTRTTGSTRTGRAGRTARTTPAGRAARADRASQTDDDAETSALAWLPYLIILAGVAVGMFVAWKGSKYAGRGAGLVGVSLLAGAVARLILPARYAGLLSSRRKASDVLALALFGAAVLAVAIALP